MKQEKKLSPKEIANKILAEWDNDSETQVDSDLKLPSRFYINQVVKLKFVKNIEQLTATVRGIHFYKGKVKYDLAIWLDDNTETRIYNVDSAFVSAA